MPPRVMDPAVMIREDLVRLLALRDNELASAHEERRDKEAAISFLKTRITTLQNQSRAASGGNSPGPAGGGGGASELEPSDRELRLEADLRRQQEVNRRLTLQLERSAQEVETLQRRLVEAKDEITFLWRELHGREVAVPQSEETSARRARSPSGRPATSLALPPSGSSRQPGPLGPPSLSSCSSPPPSARGESSAPPSEAPSQAPPLGRPRASFPAPTLPGGDGGPTPSPDAEVFAVAVALETAPAVVAAPVDTTTGPAVAAVTAAAAGAPAASRTLAASERPLLAHASPADHGGSSVVGSPGLALALAPVVARAVASATSVICIGFDDEGDKATMESKRLRMAKQMEKRRSAGGQLSLSRKGVEGGDVRPTTIRPGERGAEGGDVRPTTVRPGEIMQLDVPPAAAAAASVRGSTGGDALGFWPALDSGNAPDASPGSVSSTTASSLLQAHSTTGRLAGLRDEMKRRRNTAVPGLRSGDAMEVAEAVIAEANAAFGGVHYGAASPSPSPPVVGFGFGAGRGAAAAAKHGDSPRGGRSASSLPPSPRSASSSTAPRQVVHVASARGVASTPAGSFAPVPRVKSSNLGPSPNERIITTTVGGTAQAGFFLPLGGVSAATSAASCQRPASEPTSPDSAPSPEHLGRHADRFYAPAVGSTSVPGVSPRTGAASQPMQSARQRLASGHDFLDPAGPAASAGLGDLERSRRGPGGVHGSRPGSCSAPAGGGCSVVASPAVLSDMGGGCSAGGLEPSDPVHEAVSRFSLQRPPFRFPLVRHSRGVYLYGSKKLVIDLRNEKLMVRIGGGFVHLETYLLDVDRAAAAGPALAATPPVVVAGNSSLAAARRAARGAT